jgi:hypothetical protein
MTGSVLMLRLAAAALLSGGVAALIVLGAGLAGYAIAVAPSPWQAFDLLPSLLVRWVAEGFLAVALGTPAGAVPAFFAGAILWSAGRMHPRLRRRPAWAAAGGAIGLGCGAGFATLTGTASLSGANLVMTGVFTLAGAGAALAFRAAMPGGRASGAPSGSRRPA